MEMIVHEWGSAIAAGRLRPGTRTPTDAVARSSSVSRGTVREAMGVLETLGLVTVRQRTGITVLRSEQWNIYDEHVLGWRLAGPHRCETLREVAQLRDSLEPHAARLAAQRASAEECGVLAGAVSGLAVAERSREADTWLTHALHFHSTVLRASKNPFYARAVPLITAAFRAEPNSGSAPRSEVLRRYADSAGAIQRGDGEAAAFNMAWIVAEVARSGGHE